MFGSLALSFRLVAPVLELFSLPLALLEGIQPVFAARLANQDRAFAPSRAGRSGADRIVRVTP
ncbi:MAG: hypothetical protein ACKVXR_10675 [Planctomycetota bacterium]